MNGVGGENIHPSTVGYMTLSSISKSCLDRFHMMMTLGACANSSNVIWVLPVHRPTLIVEGHEIRYPGFQVISKPDGMVPSPNVSDGAAETFLHA